MPNLLLRTLRTMVEEDQRCLSAGGGDVEACIRGVRMKVLELLIDSYSRTSSERFSRIREYLGDVEDSLRNSGLSYLRVDLTTRSSVVLGWSPLYFVSEVPLAWDMVLDTFYVPASIVKGIMKSSMAVADATECIEELMGSRDGVGSAVFLDAYPVKAEGRALTLDVLTPHYRRDTRDEYGVKPNPVLHAVVSPGVTFRTFMAYRAGRGRCDARRELEEALKLSAELGWGRRTTRGYGAMEVRIG